MPPSCTAPPAPAACAPARGRGCPAGAPSRSLGPVGGPSGGTRAGAPGRVGGRSGRAAAQARRLAPRLRAAPPPAAPPACASISRTRSRDSSAASMASMHCQYVVSSSTAQAMPTRAMPTSPSRPPRHSRACAGVAHLGELGRAQLTRASAGCVQDAAAAARQLGQPQSLAPQFGRAGDRQPAAYRLCQGLRLPHLRHEVRHPAARGQGTSARHDEPHRVHALPPSVRRAARTSALNSLSTTQSEARLGQKARGSPKSVDNKSSMTRSSLRRVKRSDGPPSWDVLGREPPLVPVDLRVQGGQRVDAEHLAELEQIREHVGDLVGDPVRACRGRPSRAPTPRASTTGRSPPVRRPPR